MCAGSRRAKWRWTKYRSIGGQPSKLRWRMKDKLERLCLEQEAIIETQAAQIKRLLEMVALLRAGKDCEEDLL